jgi:glycine/D-amino acid oxidase-like deaminating enzyme
MTVPSVEPDVAILGGGIAGLWTLNRLRSLGFTALLFECSELGGGQTINAQGIIHGGIKYLPGEAGDQAELAAMPATWRDCLAGRGPVDLRGCRVLSDCVHLFSSGSLPARLLSALAGRHLHAQAEKLPAHRWPPILRASQPRGSVYRVDEPVLDMPSLVRTLAAPVEQDIYQVDPTNSGIYNDGGVARLDLPGCTIRPRLLLLAAGAGNAALLAKLAAKAPAMRRLPLQQAVLSGTALPPLFAHCLGSAASPRFTITSHSGTAGETLWYIGGGLASDGAAQVPERLIDRARGELASALPGLDFSQCRWATVSVDRAEGYRGSGRVTNRPFVAPVDGSANALAAWPTKLALAPALVARVENTLRERNISPGEALDPTPLAGLPRPAIAHPAWEAPAP